MSKSLMASSFLPRPSLIRGRLKFQYFHSTQSHLLNINISFFYSITASNGMPTSTENTRDEKKKSEIKETYSITCSAREEKSMLIFSSVLLYTIAKDVPKEPSKNNHCCFTELSSRVLLHEYNRHTIPLWNFQKNSKHRTLHAVHTTPKKNPLFFSRVRVQSFQS